MNLHDFKSLPLVCFASFISIGSHSLEAHDGGFPICQSENCIFVKADQPDGHGSRQHPYNNLKDVEAYSSENDVIIILNSDQELEGGLQLKDGQKLLGQYAADRSYHTALVDCSHFPDEECARKEAYGSPKIATTDDGDSPALEGDAIRLAEGGSNEIRGIHFTQTVRFAIYGKNSGGVLEGNLFENTGQTDVPERAYMPCNIEVIDANINQTKALIKTPRDELGCWMWPAAFPGDVLGPDRNNKLFFSNIAIAAVGIFANQGKHRVSIKNSIFRDFTAGRVTDAEGGDFGYAEGAEAILLSTDSDAKVLLDIDRVDIRNNANLDGERGPRVENCTYASIFTQHHDTSEAIVKLSNGLIREIGGCDGVNNQIGFLPGKSSDTLQVKLYDSNGETGAYAEGPQHTVKLKMLWNNFHIINPYDAVDNGSNKFTDAFEPIVAEHIDSIKDPSKRSHYVLKIKNSTFKENSGNGLELRFGADKIERITTALALNVKVKITKNCIINNAQADDVFSEGANSIIGRDAIIGRDFHNVHVYLPAWEDIDYQINAKRNYWGEYDHRDIFSQDDEQTQIVAILSDDDNILPATPTGPASSNSSSFLVIEDLNSVFDVSKIRRHDSHCFEAPTPRK